MRLFLVKFFILAVGILSFHYHKPLYSAVTEPWTEFLALISGKIVTLFDSNVYAEGITILTRNPINGFSGVSIEAGCNGIEAWLVLVAAILAFPMKKGDDKVFFIMLSIVASSIVVMNLLNVNLPLQFAIVCGFYMATLVLTKEGRYRLKGLILGFIAIQSLNIVRIITLFYIGLWDKAIFDFAHLYAWQVLIILDAFICFLIWLSKIPSSDLDGGDNEKLHFDIKEEKLV